MSDRVTVTENELIEALLVAMRPADGGEEGGAMRVQEMAAATNKGEVTIRRVIRALLAAGRLEMVHVRRSSIDGRIQRVPAYRFKAAAP